MNTALVMQELLKILPPDRVLKDQPMSRHTSFKIGGPADFLALPQTPQQLARIIDFCNNNGVFVKVIGNGSNLLVSDRGISGVIVKTTEMKQITQIAPTTVRAQSGAILARLANFCKDLALTGLEFAHGIPGTVGGAVYMNAGAYDGEICGVLTKSTVLDKDLNTIILANPEHEFAYRHSVFVDNPELIILESEFELAPGDPEKIKAKMDDFSARRTEKQPLNLPSAGSTFKRPDGDYASRLVDVCGLSGCTIGGASVSPKHAGFIVNNGGATFEDVTRLIQHVKDTVYEQQGIMLECEVLIIDR